MQRHSENSPACGLRGRARRRRGARPLAALGLAALASAACAGSRSARSADGFALELSGGSRDQNALVDSIRAALAPAIARGAADGSALTLDFDALYAPLAARERAFLDALRALEPEIPPSSELGSVTWERLAGQVVQTEAGPVELPLQLLPQPVARAVEAMNAAMRAEIGREVAVGSGYHSPAYQAHLFVTLIPVYGYSIRDTLRHFAQPGRSEHERPECQGLDFIDVAHADLTYSRPREVAEFPEFRWLRANARRFGFVLTNPVETPEHAFSPWHWRWQSADCPLEVPPQ
jgi:hypothetical protein